MKIDLKKRDEAMKRGTFYSYVPKHLEIPGKPELNKFPFNVLFASFAVKDGKNIMGSALYEPDFYTYEKKGDLCLMRYHNVYNVDKNVSYLIIAYDEKNKIYRGNKYVNHELVGETEGRDDWNEFFIHFTMLGLSKGERCKFDETNSNKIEEIGFKVK